MMSVILIDGLRQLPPSGQNSFEGLISELMERLTGLRFYLAKAGSQSGRDMSSERRNGNLIAVECKRYGNTTELNQRELLGELSEVAHDIPDLDIWILVTSRGSPSQLLERLSQEANSRGIEFFAFSSEDGSPSSLEILCANEPDITIEYLKRSGKNPDLVSLAQDLNAIRASQHFDEVLENLRANLKNEAIGYGNWRLSQNKWFLEHCKSEIESRGAFRQVLNVADADNHVINRGEVWKQLDQWLFDWGQTHSSCLLEGEEGDGKTWAVASWLSQRMQSTSSFPAVLFLSSMAVNSDNPDSLFVDAISQQGNVARREIIDARLFRWLKRRTGESPLIILVLDGINERRASSWWRGLFEKLIAPPWSQQIGLLITCRTVYWNQYFKNLHYFQPQIYVVPPYNNDELSEALGRHNLKIPDIPRSVFPLLRKPRYFDLMIRHRNRMAESGDITPARLIYEDWRDRYERKSSFPMDERSFQDLIVEIAQKSRTVVSSIKRQEVIEILSQYQENDVILQELITGKLLQNINGQYRVEPRLLELGLGLLLADQVRQGCQEPGENLDEIIAGWLEPQPDIEIKAAICGVAVLHSMTAEDYSMDCQLSLLKWWISAQNPPQEVEDSFIAYLPLNPKTYLLLAERVWGDTTDNSWGKELIVRALMKWRHMEKVEAEFIIAFEKWLGFIYQNGSLPRRERSEVDIQEERAKITERVGFELVPGTIRFAGYPFTVIEQPGLLALGKVALAVISHMRRESFIRAISIGCVSEAIVDFPDKYDLFKWVLRSSQNAISNEVNQEAEYHITLNTLITLQAAYRLLTAEGGPEAIELRDTLPQDLFPPHPYIAELNMDPCGSGLPWKRDHIEECLKRKDLEVQWIARQMKRFCIDPDLQLPEEWPGHLATVVSQIHPESLWTNLYPTGDQLLFEEVEPVLCAYSPEALISLIQAIFQSAKKRTELALRQFALSIDEYLPLFGVEERKAVQDIWLALQNQTNPWTDTRATAERALFLLILQISRNGDEQLQFLLQRHPNAQDYVVFEGLFRPIDQWGTVLDMLREKQDENTLRRMLWFLSSSEESYPQEIGPLISSFLIHDDSHIRWLAMVILFKIGDSKYLDPFIHSAWSYDYKTHLPVEDHWGSLILCRFGSSLPYKDLRNRIQPNLLGYAIKLRGFIPEEVDQFAMDVFRMWQYSAAEGINLPADFPTIEIERSAIEDITIFERYRIAEEELTSLATAAGRNMYWGEEPIDFQKFSDLLSDAYFKNHQEQLRQIVQEAIQEQAKAGNELFSRSFPPDSIEKAMEQNPEIFNTMIEAILVESPGASRTLVLRRGLYETLCGILIDQGSERGLALYRKLSDPTLVRIVEPDTKIRWINFLLFSGPEEAGFIAEWDTMFTHCTTNKELMELVITAVSGNGKHWLKSRIRSGLQSSVQLERARSIAILGFLDDEEAKPLLQQEMFSALDTWVRKVAGEAWQHWQKNVWAKTWFSHFLADEDDVRSWAAFRLFLKCVDRRFILWKQQEIGLATIKTGGYDRLAFLECQTGVIENNIKENEKSLHETFLSQKVLKREVWPWMRIGE